MNGATYDVGRKSGVLYLNPIAGSNEFTVAFPTFVMLSAIKSLELCDYTFLLPFWPINGNAFEYFVAHALRLKFNLSKSSVTLGELLSGARFIDPTLSNMKVSINTVDCVAPASMKASLVTDVKRFPVQGSTSAPVELDVSKGTCIVVNFAMDHAPDLIGPVFTDDLGNQHCLVTFCKSSGESWKGNATTPTKVQNSLLESDEINRKPTLEGKFGKQLFLQVTNGEFKNTKTPFTKRDIIVDKNNWTQFFGVQFSHRRLLIQPQPEQLPTQSP